MATEEEYASRFSEKSIKKRKEQVDNLNYVEDSLSEILCCKQGLKDSMMNFVKRERIKISDERYRNLFNEIKNLLDDKCSQIRLSKLRE